MCGFADAGTASREVPIARATRCNRRDRTRFQTRDVREPQMQSKLIYQADGQRNFVVILATGDEVVAALKEFAEREQLNAARFTAIGALSDAQLGYFDWQKKDYTHIPVKEQVEVASFIGDLAFTDKG